LRPLSPQFRSFPWAISSAEAARIAGIEPHEVLRLDGNTTPEPPAAARPETVAGALTRIHTYAHGGHPELLRAIADYARVAPEQVVLGAGADDLIMLAARSFAGPGDRVAVADEPTYPMYRIGASDRRGAAAARGAPGGARNTVEHDVQPRPGRRLRRAADACAHGSLLGARSG
jgi:histidinol-phosphate/aromatic aminotransferase/cobyric acid decarboxylase-like protein